jgi:endonuclease/exonuclease/phosphatase family metal-dependent hydrolase
MGFPLTFTVCTYNLWATYRWPDRKVALQKFAEYHSPDILCVQEARPENLAVLDEALRATHRRIDDPFEGWTHEGNIYWNTTLFDLVNYGAEQIGILEEHRRLFWARLRIKESDHPAILVSTAHYTWSGHAQAVATEKTYRIPQARATLETLDRLRDRVEPILFMGDLNDNEVPIEILYQGGLLDCFSALGRAPHWTWPVLPTSLGAPTTLDWIMHRGALRARSAEVIDFFDSDIAPSDHKPVLATYQFISGG